MARSYGVVPVASDGFSILLTVDPFNPHLAGDLAFVPRTARRAPRDGGSG